MKLLGKILSILIAFAMAIVILVAGAKAANAPVVNSVATPTPTANTPATKNKGTGDYSKVKILVYHTVSPAPEKKESRMAVHYRVTPEVFAQQMQYLKDNGYAPTTLAKLITEIANGGPNPDKQVVITFDDGWKSQYLYAVPVMEHYGFTATFGIITENVGRTIDGEPLDAPELTNTSKMTWPQIKDLLARGFEIASHSQTHPMLTKVTNDQLVAEVVDSKKTLEEKLGVPVTTFIYPYYNYDPRVMKAVQDAGYLGARGGFGGFKNTSDHIYQLVAQEVVNNPNPFKTE